MPEVFKRFWADTALIRKKFPIHCVKSDNAGENKSQALNEFFISKGVRREFSTPNRAEQNGFAELYIRELVRLTRLLLRISGLPHTFWLRAFLHAADLLNLKPVPTEDSLITPYEMIHGMKPNVKNFHPFGISCTVRLNAKTGDTTFKSKGVPAIYVGRATDAKMHCHICFIPSTKTFVHTNEMLAGNTFPYGKSASAYYPHLATPDSEFSFLHMPSEEFSIREIVDQFDTVYLVQLHSGEQCTILKQDLVGRMMFNDLHLPQPDGRSEPYSLKPKQQLDYFIYVQDCLMSDDAEPKTWKQAMQSADADKWIAAHADEMSGLQARGVFRIVTPPEGANILDTLLVLKTKIDPVTGEKTHKVRLCLRGDQQTEDDYFDNHTYSAVINGTELRTLCSLAGANNFHADAIDIVKAFTYGLLDTPLYCHPPEGYEVKPGEKFELLRALYGCRQAAACFKDETEKFYFSQGFHAVNDAKTIFKLKEQESFIISGIFVDDSLNVHNDYSLFNR